MDDKVNKIGFWQDYLNWLGGKPHLPLLKKYRRIWILLFSTMIVIGPGAIDKNQVRFFTQLLSFAGITLIYFALQKRIANNKGIRVNEVPSNYVALIGILIVNAILNYLLLAA